MTYNIRLQIYTTANITGYKPQEDQQIPADPYPFCKCYHILLFGETKVKNISVSSGLKLIIYRKGTIFGFDNFPPLSYGLFDKNKLVWRIVF